MASGLLKSVSKRRSAKNGDIDDMTAAVHGNEDTLAKDIEEEKLREMDEVDDTFGRGSRRKRTKTYYGDSGDEKTGHFAAAKEKQKPKGTKGKKNSIGTNIKILANEGDEDEAPPSAKKTSTSRLSPLKGSPNKLRVARSPTSGDPCCECNVFISLAMQQNGYVQAEHNHYCKGVCGKPMHGFCGVAQSEEQQMNRICTRCQNNDQKAIMNSTPSVQTSNTISATNVKTKKRKAESSQSTEIQDGGVKNLTKDENTPKEGERKSHGGARAGVGRKKKEKSQEEVDAIREEVMSNEREKQGLVRLAYMLNVKYKDNSQTFIQLLLGIKSNEESGGLQNHALTGTKVVLNSLTNAMKDVSITFKDEYALKFLITIVRPGILSANWERNVR
jgi:hypothetical protein